MSSSLGYSFISDKNENKKSVEVSKPKRNITIKKKKSFLNGIQKILSRSDDSDDLDDFKPLKKEENKEINDEDDEEVSMQSFKKMADENNSVKNYMENFTAMGGQPINDNTIVDSHNQQQPNDITDGYLTTYVPHYTKLDNNKDLSGSEDSLMKKLNYMIHLLEEQQDQKTENVTEELVLYSFLGIFVIFVVDGFARAGKYTR